MKSNTRFFLGLCFLITFSFSLSAQDTKALFDEAKSLLDRNQYALALGRFKTISELNQDSDLVRYSIFYAAISAYNSGDADLAKNLFSKIKSKYSDWGDANQEVTFWLAKIAFQNGDAAEGLEYLETIESNELSAAGENLKKQHFTSVTDVDQLKSLLEIYPDKIIASRLLDELLALNIMNQDFELIDRLLDEYEISPKADIEGITVSPKKEIYNIGLFFPFQYQSDSAGVLRMINDWPIRFLQGMKLGLNKLEAEGINVNLLTFDTRTTALATRNILDDPRLKSLDLIVGPAYPGPLGEVAKYAKANKINFVNPLSSNSEILIDNPFAFLYFPSNESLAIKAAQYTKTHLTKNKNTAIFFSSEADRVRAEMYRKLIEKDSFNVVIYEMIRPNESVRIQQMLVDEIDVDVEPEVRERMITEMDSLLKAKVRNWEIYDEDDFKIKKQRIADDSIGHIFIASDIPALSASVISGIDVRQDTIVYVGSSRWLSSEQSISFSQLERVNAVFTGSNWIDYDKASVGEFRDRFLKKYSAFPRKEDRLADAYLGYDIMVTFGRLLNQYGKYFQLGLVSEKNIHGELTDALNYQLSNDNRFIPILKMENSKVRKTNN